MQREIHRADMYVCVWGGMCVVGLRRAFSFGNGNAGLTVH